MKTPNEDSIGSLVELEVGLIDFDPKNRKEHDGAKLKSLADSINSEGLLQPLVVRNHPSKSGRFMLIAGERRLRALLLLKQKAAPVRVVGGSAVTGDLSAAKKRLVENMQRENLSPIEEARGYRELAVDHKMTQAAIGALASVGQSTVANSLRLLEVPSEVQQLVQDGKLSRAHGVALCRFAKWPKIVKRMAELAVKGGETSKELEDDDVPYSHSLKREKLIVECTEYDYNRDHEYEVPAALLKDPAFIGSANNCFCMEPAKWEPEQKRQDAVAASKKKTQEKAESSRQSKMTPKEKAERQKVIAENKQARAESLLAKPVLIERIKAFKEFDGASITALAATAVGAHWKYGRGERVKDLAAGLGIKLPKGFAASDVESMAKLKPVDAMRLAVAALVDADAEEAIKYAHPICDRVELVLGAGMTKMLRTKAAATLAAKKGGKAK